MWSEKLRFACLERHASPRGWRTGMCKKNAWVGVWEKNIGEKVLGKYSYGGG